MKCCWVAKEAAGLPGQWLGCREMWSGTARNVFQTFSFSCLSSFQYFRTISLEACCRRWRCKCDPSSGLGGTSVGLSLVCALQGWAEGWCKGFNFCSLGQEETIAEEEVPEQCGCLDSVPVLCVCVLCLHIKEILSTVPRLGRRQSEWHGMARHSVVCLPACSQAA